MRNLAIKRTDLDSAGFARMLKKHHPLVFRSPARFPWRSSVCSQTKITLPQKTRPNLSPFGPIYRCVMFFDYPLSTLYRLLPMATHLKSQISNSHFPLLARSQPPARPLHLENGEFWGNPRLSRSFNLTLQFITPTSYETFVAEEFVPLYEGHAAHV